MLEQRVEGAASQPRAGKQCHRAKQRSHSSSVPADPATVKVAHISARQSMDEDCPPSAAELPVCDADCHCQHEAEQKEDIAEDDEALLSAIIVIESPPPNNRQLLLQPADVDGRPASSSHSTDVPPTAAIAATATATAHSIDPSLSPDSTHTTTLPHSIVSMPSSPLVTASTAQYHSGTDGQPPHRALSASSSRKASFSSPSHSRQQSHSAAVTACPLHTRNHSLSILQVLRESQPLTQPVDDLQPRADRKRGEGRRWRRRGERGSGGGGRSGREVEGFHGRWRGEGDERRHRTQLSTNLSCTR